MLTQRHSLASVYGRDQGTTDESGMLALTNEATSLGQFGRFKYGDRSIARRYGEQLAELFLSLPVARDSSDSVAVTTAAYGVGPPAAAELAPTFIQQLRKSLPLRGAGLDTFKVAKRLPFVDVKSPHAIRAERLAQTLLVTGGLDLASRVVVVLDDIRVSGLRETALTSVLRSAGALHVTYLYVLEADASAGANVEATINKMAVRSTGDAVSLIRSSDYKLTLRMCKFFLALPPADQNLLLQAFSRTERDELNCYIDGDDLRAVVKHVP